MEIKASAVRRGNYLKYRYKDKPVMIHVISANQINASNVRYFKGIPLTPEILLKAGFEKSKHGWFDKMPVARFTIEKSNGDAYMIYSGYDADGEPNLIAIVYHFHQLQNFWASCNLGELKIEL